MSNNTKYLKIACNLLIFVVTLLLIIKVVPKVMVFFSPFVVGFVISLMVNPVIRFLERKIKIKRKYSFTFLTVLLIGIIVLICYGIVVGLVNGIQGFVANFPDMYDKALVEIVTAFEQLQKFADKIPFVDSLHIGQIQAYLQNWLNEFIDTYKGPTISALGDFAKSLPSVLINVLVGVFAAYYFVVNRDKIHELVKKHTPGVVLEYAHKAYEGVILAICGYFKAQLKIMCIIYIVIMAGLFILRVDYAWLIGLGIAFLDMLPIFGTGTVLIPWAVIKLFSGEFGIAIGMVILYVVALIVHQVIQPKLIGDSVGLDTFMALFFMFIGYRIKGILGMIIAIPIGMVLCNFYKMGVFDRIIWCIRELGKGLWEFCRIDRK